MPNTPLRVTPAAVDINPDSSCPFKADPDQQVQWTITPPDAGKIDQNGVYTAPKWVLTGQTITVTATTAANPPESATATINLLNVPGVIRWLGWYAVALAILLGIAIVVTWCYLYTPAESPLVIVGPPIVTLDFDKDEKYTFIATVLGDDKNGVTWSVEGDGQIDSSGLYQLKANTASKHSVKITARSTLDPSSTGSAIINLASGEETEVLPSSASVFSSQQVPFRLPGAKPKWKPAWSVSRSDLGLISADGVFTAIGLRDKVSVLQVTVWDENATPKAAAAVVVNPRHGTFGLQDCLQIFFVILCGSLGSMLYFASSFVNFVGNRTFKSSWFWFYISRPFVGGALALIFYFVAVAGFLKGTPSANLPTIAMISALVGLFSEKAVKKLSDILDVLLATKDDRKDKVDEKSGPKIDSTDPPNVPPGKDTSVQVKGSNFGTTPKVTVNGTVVTPTGVTDHAFTITVSAAQAKAPNIKIGVTADNGSTSFDLPVVPPVAGAVAPPAAGTPKIDSTDPPNVPPGKDTSVQVKGSNFGTTPKVTVNGTVVTPTGVTDHAFTITVSAAQANAPGVKISVTTGNGATEFDLRVA